MITSALNPLWAARARHQSDGPLTRRIWWRTIRRVESRFFQLKFGHLPILIFVWRVRLGIEDGAVALIMLHAHRVSIYEASMCKSSILMRGPVDDRWSARCLRILTRPADCRIHVRRKV